MTQADIGGKQLTSPDLRAAITAMLRLIAGVEEGALLALDPRERKETGSATLWSLSAAVAHNTEFKRQQVVRLQAAHSRQTPPEFAEIDHRSDAVYAGFAALSWKAALEDSRRTTAALIDGLWRVGYEDLTDPDRLPWLHGRPLWLQVVVRGFWHPGGHLGECLMARNQGARALRLHRAGVALAEAVDLPPAARGMAHYSLACAEALSGDPSASLGSIGRALALNPDLALNARRDPDLATARALAAWPLPGI
jgi:hypothetical protein